MPLYCDGMPLHSDGSVDGMPLECQPFSWVPVKLMVALSPPSKDPSGRQTIPLEGRSQETWDCFWLHLSSTKLRVIASQSSQVKKKKIKSI